MTKDDIRYLFSNILLTIGVVAPVCLTIVAMCLIFG